MKFDLVTKHFKKMHSENTFVTVASINAGIIMIGKSRSGIEYVDENLLPVNIEKELGDNTFTYAVKDYQGGSWMSTLESGVFYSPKRSISDLKISEAGEIIHKLNKLNDSSLLVSVNPGKIFHFHISHDNKVKQKMYLIP
ncbi:MAG: hypothetical protein IPJ60_07585 [Sphingobacteriaceae bacterium]|nr:hypothetical protein [Sphingobacteriaceae bacterium]